MEAKNFKINTHPTNLRFNELYAIVCFCKSKLFVP